MHNPVSNELCEGSFSQYCDIYRGKPEKMQALTIPPCLLGTSG